MSSRGVKTIESNRFESETLMRYAEYDRLTFVNLQRAVPDFSRRERISAAGRRRNELILRLCIPLPFRSRIKCDGKPGFPHNPGHGVEDTFFDT